MRADHPKIRERLRLDQGRALQGQRNMSEGQLRGLRSILARLFLPDVRAADR